MRRSTKDGRIAVAKITGQGLSAIAISVTLLWACILGENLIRREAALEARRVLRENHLMQRRRALQPVSTPVRLPRLPRPQMG